ncbi:MAG: sugar ABC transporter ATP-binding protein [Phycisphaerales bacterium]|nr:sugar ABC transporter ATP-binding protein [Phycisphaerales bacterium]
MFASHPDDCTLLEMRNITKSFDGVPVLLGVNFDLRAGEVHALVGENGAGKSTLIKVLAGVHRDWGGDVWLRGRTVRFSGPRAASQAGVAVIHQELALVPGLTVAENLFLGREPRTPWGTLNRHTMDTRAAAVLQEDLGIQVDPRGLAGALPLATRQVLEIAKALLIYDDGTSRGAGLLVLDEPTSALSDEEARRLFAIIRRLRERGAGVVYVSHRMEEIYALADRITVLRDGRQVCTATPAELPPDELVARMVGRTFAAPTARQDAATGPVRLEVRSVALRSADGRRTALHDIELVVRAGEMVGLTGLLGSGASELLGAIYGRYGRLDSGQILVDGVPVRNLVPRTALARGIALLTNDRQASGLVLPLSVLANVTLAALPECTRVGLLRSARERAIYAASAGRLAVKTPSIHAAVRTLSGGNQQKVLLARWLATRPLVLLLDEPTRGIDVAAKAEIYALLRALARDGVGLVICTSELPELLALADRVLVLRRGRIVTELPRGMATQETVLHAAMGGE